ncbi:MAG: hypothetical protein J7K21_07615 [Desulfurococcales archaeon]|nr:hypothetical protein [Desulfurococcales archaeon]
MTSVLETVLPCIDKCISEMDTAGCFVNCSIGEEPILEAREWIKVFKKEVEVLKKNYKLHTVLYSREFGSFLRNPWLHLRKKLFIYTHDLRRGMISREDYARKALAAIRTSLRTNLRTLYQNWVFVATINLLHQPGSYILYPEHRVFSLERSGKQKLRWIPPNLVIDLPRIGSLSFYIEVPRPIAWEDTSDLKESWRYYIALRPDMMVYGGQVMDIVDPGQSPPIKKPDLIIECKELIDWYVRVRDVKGPLAKPLTAEEWRNRWIQGLWDGLASVLGVTRREAIEQVSERRGVRLSEVKVVELYRTVYNPKKMILVSKYSIPDEVRRELEQHDIEVIDNIGFNREKLTPLADVLKKYAKPPKEYVIKTSDPELAHLLTEIKQLVEQEGIDTKRIEELIMKNLVSIA